MPIYHLITHPLRALLTQDFRSSDGLYNIVKSRHPNAVLKGKDLFSAGLFREPESTRLFYAFIAQLKSSIDAAEPGSTHRFLKTLDSKGKLLRSYTQNIDGFEEKVGILSTSSAKGKGKKINTKDIRNVQLHGDIQYAFSLFFSSSMRLYIDDVSLSRVRCILCSAEYPCEPAYLTAFLDGIPPDCPDCAERCECTCLNHRKCGASC